jgi:hypothetical protein
MLGQVRGKLVWGGKDVTKFIEERVDTSVQRGIWILFNAVAKGRRGSQTDTSYTQFLSSEVNKSVSVCHKGHRRGSRRLRWWRKSFTEM